MNNDHIKIKMIYNGKTVTVELPKNKPFKLLREKAYHFFYPFPQNYIFYEKKMPLNINEDKSFGNIFGTRNSIILTIKETNNNLIDNQNNFIKKICKECQQEKENETFYYCRDCNLFICKSCRLNSESGKHYEHSIVQLFEINDSKGIKRNIELYKQILMNDMNYLREKIKECKIINNSKVDIITWKKKLHEKILIIGNLLFKKNEHRNKIEESEVIKDKSEIQNIRFDIENIKNEYNIEEINKDPLIEINKINRFDQKLITFGTNLDKQIKNEKINDDIISMKNNVEQLFDDLIND